MCLMKVSASIQKARTPLALVQPLGAHDVALEAHVPGLGGGEGVKSWIREGRPHSREKLAVHGRRHHSARPRSSALGTSRASTR